MTKEKGTEPREAAKDEGLSRRSAIKRIAAGLAGAGAVVVTGFIGIQTPLMQKPPYGDSVKPPPSDGFPAQPAPPQSGPRYGDAVKPPPRDKTPN